MDWSRLLKEVQPLAASRINLFGNDSLFTRTLAKALTAEQRARYEKIERERREFQHRAGVELTVLRMSTALGLSDDQRRRLEELLLKETRPARSFNRLYPTTCFNIVYVQMAHLPAERLKPLFEAWQWGALKRKLEKASRFEEGLAHNGVVLDGQGPQFGRFAPGPSRRSRACHGGWPGGNKKSGPRNCFRGPLGYQQLFSFSPFSLRWSIVPNESSGLSN